MKELNYRGLLPDIGSIAVLGKDIEEPLIRALSYKIAIVFLRNKYHTISVEYTSYLSDLIEPIISLYGEVVSRRETACGNTVVDIIPVEEDVEELRKLLKEVPGVVEVGIFPIIPYKKIVLK